MTSFDEDSLRRWLVDYLVTNVGCSPDLDPDASMSDLGVTSRDAVVLSGELSELLGRAMSPVEFWQHPNVSALARFLAGGDADAGQVASGTGRAVLDEPLAVVGLGCRFPGDVAGPEGLWRFLDEGRSAVSQVPADRWSAFDDGSPEAAATLSGTTRWGSFLSDVSAFDADFFEVSPREAAKMDPQQRLLLEVTWEALEDAGIPADSLRQTATGVFAGACLGEYGFLASSDLSEVDALSGTGGALSVIANRVSYFFDLRGPSVTVDTACSSSLVAVHLACQSLRTGESDVALAAGVNLLLSPVVTRSFDVAEAMSLSGGCHPFDASADGFVRGEGCGVAVLKRLSDARRDGNRVLAVVRGSAVNQDGRSNGLMAPNPSAQMAVLRAAYANAGVEPGDVDYIEAHGTGTLLGDPIEARALGTVLGGARAQDASLLVGAVKSNLGHLEAAAGIAGFIKTVLAIQGRGIPANVGFREPNPHIPFDQLGLKVVAEATDWPVTSHPRRAGVSSFGFGGTNAHVVIEQAPSPEPAPVQASDSPVTTLVVSGKSDDRLAATAAMLADWMDGDGAEAQLAAVAHTLNHHRSRHGKFATVAACDRRQAVAGLRALAEGYPAPGVVRPHRGSCRPGVVFVYSGQGAQWTGMGRQLLADEPAFSTAVTELEPAFVEQVGFSLRQVLEGGEPLVGIDQIQPVLVGIQLALTELWRSYGVVPDAVIGHSMGEVAAAVVSGALRPAEGLRVIATRSRLMKRLSGQGAMALLELDADAAATVIAEHSEVGVAVYASPRQTVIAGPPEQVDAVIVAVDANDRLARRIEVDVASHHRTVDPILPELRSTLADLAPRIPTIPVISTVCDSPGFDADHWVANLRNPVRFHQAIVAVGEENATFVEVSPHPLLTHAINDILAEAHHHVIATLHRDAHDTLAFHTNLNATHTTYPPTTEHPPEPHLQLPTTPWHHTHHWFTTRTLKSRRDNAIQTQPAPPDYDGVPSDWLHELTWPVREPVAEDAGPDTSSSWLMLCNADLATEFGQAFGSDAQMAVLEPSTLDGDADNAALLDALSSTDNVLYAPPVSSVHLDVSSAYRLFHAVRRLATTLAGLTPTPPKLFVVTRNAQPINRGDRANPVHAILWGLGRTLALEHPEIWGAIIDVDDAVPPELVAQYLRAEVQAADGEDQVVYRSSARHVPRLRRWHPPAPQPGSLGDGSHLVIGATGSIGPHLIRQLSDMKAKTIVAVSRRGNRLAELTASVAEAGTTLVEVAADAADEVAMATLFERFGTDLPALEGIYLSALAGGPVLLDDMTDDDVDAMFHPKLDAVSLLHKLSLKTPIRQFVVFSSITGVIGSRWLAHYTAAGAFLDAFGYARQALGLAATVIDWGLWQASAAEQRASTDVGLQPMAPDVAVRALPTLTGADSVDRPAVVAADWTRLAAAYRMRGPLHVVDDLLAGQAPKPRPGTLLGEPIAADNHTATQLWRARLLPDDKPYPGSHRIHGVDVVPVSVLLATISAAAAEAGATSLSDIRFEYPVLVDQPRVIHVEADDESVTVSSSPAADNTAEPVRHLSARLSQQPADSHPAGPESGDDHDVTPYDAAKLAELQRSFGIDGQPFLWSINSCRLASDRLHAEVDLPDASAVALLDASVHVARLAGSSNQRLMFPATLDQAWFGAGFADPHGSVEVYRRDADDDEFVVDIVAKAPDGSICVDIRGLHYAAMDAAPSQATSHDQPARLSLSEMSAETMLSELKAQLTVILACELGMPASALDEDRPFPELGLDSMIAVSLLREAKKLVGIDLSATMLWDHPTISSLSACIVEQLAPQEFPKHSGSEDRHADVVPDSTDGVLDELFDSVESATVGSDSAIR